MKQLALARTTNSVQNSEAFWWALLSGLWLAVFILRFFHHVDFDVEQAASGMLGAGLVDGLASSPWLYEFKCSSGTTLYGVLLYPLYSLFGSQYLWVKLVGSLFVAGGAALWTHNLRRAWGLPAALLFFLWTIFPPPCLEWSFHQAFANHMESVLFSGALVFLFLRADASPPKFAGMAVLGLAAAVACLFCLDNLLIAAAVGAATVWRWRGPGLRRLLWPGLVVFGAVFSANWLVLPQRITLVHDVLGALTKTCWSKWRDLFGAILPNYPGYRPPLGRWLSGGYLALAAAGLAGAAWAAWTEARRPAERAATDRGFWLAVVLLFHVVLYVVGYGVTSYAMATQYAAAFWSERYVLPICFSLAAFAVWPIIRLRARWRWLVVAPFLVAGFLNVFPGGRVEVRHIPKSLRLLQTMRGDDYAHYIYDRENLPSSWRRFDDALASAARLPRQWRHDGYVSAGAWLRPEETLAEVRRRAVPPDVRRLVLTGIGLTMTGSYFLNDLRKSSGDDKMASFLADLRGLDQTEIGALWEGIGYGICDSVGRHLYQDRVTPDGGAATPPDARRAVQATAALLRERLAAGADAADFASFVRGYTRHIGELEIPFDGGAAVAFAASWSETFPAIDAAATNTAFFEGYADGLAMKFINYRNRFDANALPIDLTALREALGRRGVTLRPGPGRPAEYDLAAGAE